MSILNVRNAYKKYQKVDIQPTQKKERTENDIFIFY